MIHYIKVLVFTFLVSLLATRFLLLIAGPIRLIDIPGGRKSHSGHVPVVGGIAMFISVIATFIFKVPITPPYRCFVFASFLLIFIGVLDDRQEVSPTLRLIMQIMAGLCMIGWGGVSLHNLGNLLFLGDIHLSLLSIPVTLFGIVSVINAINMTDGLDGLAGILVLVAFLLLSVLALWAQDYYTVNILTMFIGALLGFLYYNFGLFKQLRVKVFMGDAGSMFLGFSLAWFAVLLTQGGSAIARPVELLWIMALPLYDFLAVFIRRVCQKRSLFTPDRQHFHYILLDLGFSSRKTTLFAGMYALLLGAFGMALFYTQVSEGVSFLIFLGVFAIYFALTRSGLNYIGNRVT